MATAGAAQCVLSVGFFTGLFLLVVTARSCCGRAGPETRTEVRPRRLVVNNAGYGHSGRSKS